MGGGLQFTPYMFAIIFLSFLCISFFMGILVHAALMYEDKQKDSARSWILCMVAGTGITLWMFLYGYYINYIG